MGRTEMFQRILVATGGSDASHAAVESAIQMAKEQGAQRGIIYVMNLYGYYFSGGEAIAFFDEEGKRILEQAIAQARQAGVMAESHLAETVNGPRVADMTTEEVKQWPADLTVVGGHRRRGVNRLLLGSVVEGICRMANTPVLPVRPTGHEHTS